MTFTYLYLSLLSVPLDSITDDSSPITFIHFLPGPARGQVNVTLYEGLTTWFNGWLTGHGGTVYQ